MSKVFGFDEASFRRVQDATRRVLGTANRGSQRTRRQPVVGGGGATIIQAHGGPWTIAEYDPVTGDIIATFDRGRRRSTTSTLTDFDMIVSSDGYLYAIGAGGINRDSGCIVKWDINTSDLNARRIWDSDRNGFNTPTMPSADLGGNGANAVLHLLEASDGAIWGGPGPDTSSHVGRFNATSGAQTHAGFGGATYALVAPLTTRGRS